MKNHIYLATALVMLGFAGPLVSVEPVVVIGHAGLPKTDAATIARLYTGRTLSVGAQQATPYSLPVSNWARQQFLGNYLGQTEEQYSGYWLVRRYVGKGAPPGEISNVDDMLKYVANTPGAVGYVPASKVPQNANVLLR